MLFGQSSTEALVGRFVEISISDYAILDERCFTGSDENESHNLRLELYRFGMNGLIAGFQLKKWFLEEFI